jgi:hypothetical protein
MNWSNIDWRVRVSLGAEEAANLTGVPNIPQKGTCLGNGLTREQARELLAVPHPVDAQGQAGLHDPGHPGRLRPAPGGAGRSRSTGRRVRTLAIRAWVKQGINA